MAIVGLGLMGGSLAMALKGKCARLSGIESDHAILKQALELGIIDKGYGSLNEITNPIDVIILAIPVQSILSMLGDLHTQYSGHALVLDLGSTKQQILREMEKLPQRFDPLGGHPMCGKEVSGLASADGKLYKGATFAFCAMERTGGKARQLAEELSIAVGAVPFWCDAASHDQWVALTSHLPYLLANTLAAMTPLAAAPLAGPGYMSTSRLAPAPIHIMQDILVTNQANILAGIQEFQSLLSNVATALAAKETDQITRLLCDGKTQHNAITQILSKGKKE